MNEKQYKSYKNAVKKYRESLEKGKLNDNSHDSLESRYKKSFEISIDVSKLLKVYKSYLKQINKMLSNINVENENKLDNYKAINDELSKKIQNMHQELSSNINKIEAGLKTKKYSKADMIQYKNLIERIKKDTSALIF